MKRCFRVAADIPALSPCCYVRYTSDSSTKKYAVEPATGLPDSVKFSTDFYSLQDSPVAQHAKRVSS
jgi:hypothetical protein